MFHLEVGEGGLTARAPVGDALSPVDEALLVEVDEGFADGLRRAFVEGEPPACPVAGRAQALQLLEYPVAVLIDPLPDALDELLSSEVVTGDAVGGEGAFDDDLGCDAGVVGAWKVECWLALHPVPANHEVFEGLG